MFFAFELTSGQWARSTEIGHPLSAKSDCILSAILSHTPCGLSSLIQFHFFSESGSINDHCPFPNLFAYRDTSGTFARHHSSLSFVPQEMSMNIDINMILPVNFSGVSSTLNSKRFVSSQHGIRKDVDLRALKIGDSFVTNQ